MATHIFPVVCLVALVSAVGCQQQDPARKFVRWANQHETLLKARSNKELRLEVVDDIDEIYYVKLKTRAETDVLPLASLKNLGKLSLNATRQEIDSLGACANLVDLDLLCAGAKDVDPLGPLSDLRHLTLTLPETTTCDISAVGGLRGLETVFLDGPIDDLRVLSELPRLKLLTLEGVSATRLPQLAAPLRELRIYNTHLADISSLVSRDLKDLMIVRSPVKDISKLAELTSLESLNVDIDHAIGLGPLRQLTNLEWLFLGLRGTGRVDLSPLQGMSKMQTLQIRIRGATQVDLAPLRQMPKLHNLSLDFADATKVDLSPLEALSQLESVKIHCPKVTDEQLNRLVTKLPDCWVGRIDEEYTMNRQWRTGQRFREWSKR